MSQPFLGQISIFGFNFAPRGWAQCSGQQISIAQNQALFALLGTQFGGNGQTTFALPDLRGRVPVHNTNEMGVTGGQESVTLTTATMPAHTHTLNATTAVANKRVATGKIFAADNATIAEYYAVPGPNVVPLSSQSITNAGGSQPHDNTQPYLALNICIAMEGIFPSRN